MLGANDPPKTGYKGGVSILRLGDARIQLGDRLARPQFQKIAITPERDRMPPSL